MGQEHVLLVNIYRDTSYIIFKSIEKENLEIIIKSPITEREN